MELLAIRATVGLLAGTAFLLLLGFPTRTAVFLQCVMGVVIGTVLLWGKV